MAFSIFKRNRPPGVTQPDVWRRVAATLGGVYHEAGKRQHDHVLVQRGPWELKLGKQIVNNGQYGTTVYTRVGADFLAEDDFGFELSVRRWYSGFPWPFLPPDVPIGDPEIEDRYVLRSRHAARVRSAFSDREIRDLIRVQPSMRLGVKGHGWWAARTRGTRARRAFVRTTGVLTDHDRLVDYVRLIETLLGELVRIGCAVESPVHPDRHNGDLRRRL